MSEELEKIGIDVWIAGTIYVDAETDEEARKIVSERYAGTRTNTFGLDLLDGPDFPLEGEEFMSGAITLYGVGGDSVLLPAVDPVREAAPDMLAALKEASDALAGTLMARGYRPGTDISVWAPEVQAELRALVAVRAAIAKAEGRANG